MRLMSRHRNTAAPVYATGRASDYVAAMFPALIMPAQADYPRKLSGEQRLRAELIDTAMHDLRTVAGVAAYDTTKHAREVYANAWHWLMGHRAMITLTECCEVLALDAAAISERIRRDYPEPAVAFPRSR